MISPAMIASLVFGICGLIAAAAVEYLLRQFAEEAGINAWIFIAVPALFAMLFALLLYQDAQRKIRRVGESVSRGILIAMLTWLSFSLLASVVWCPPRTFGQCTGHTLLAAAIVGGGPMLAAALLAGILTGVLIIRPPRPQRREES
jgi:membrane associated rhomboid family serine protease